MHYHKGALGLIIPNAQTLSDLKLQKSIDLIQAKVWRESLSMHDLKGSIQSVNHFLKNLSQTNTPPSDKLEILSLTRPIVSFLCSAIENLSQKNSSYRTAKDKEQIFQIKLSLQLALFNQFKFSLEQALSNKRLNQDIIAELVFACLQQSCKILFLSYQNYQIAPKFVWLETHILYQFSQKEAFECENISTAKHLHSQFSCIADIYKHTLIFALTNPCRFQQSDMLKLYYAIEAWAPLLQLHENNPTLFIVDLMQDTPPHYATIDSNIAQNTSKKENDNTDIYFLSFDNILKRINKLLRHCEISSTKQSCSPPLNAQELNLCSNILNSLLHTWKQTSQRKSNRTLSTGTRTVAVGLKAIHWFATEVQFEVEKQQDLKNQVKEQQSNQEQNILIENDEAEIEEIILDSFSLPQELQDQQIANATPCSIECSIIDRSDSGYCLKWEHCHSGQLKIDELIGVLDESDSEYIHWTIAVIRWIQNTDSDHKLIGIETLSLNAIPIYLQQTEQNINHTSPEKGLFISKILNSQTPFIIITPKFSCKPEEHSQVTTQGKSYSAHFVQDLSLSPLYAFWEVELDDGPTENQPITQFNQPPQNP